MKVDIIQELLILIYRICRKVFYSVNSHLSQTFTVLLLYLNRVKYGNRMISKGIPVINVKKSGKFVIGDDLTINNGRYYNQIGRQQPCYFIVGAKAVLTIGNNVGISSTTIVCMNNISIADNVKIGGNVVIYDTDFHSVHVHERVAMIEDASVIKTVPVCIKKNVFIGAHTTILKGVTIGENSIIGAGCVVAKDIPDNEVWVGNPAKFIKKV